jgi:hypothetical protein
VRGGALALALMGGMGMAAPGLVTSPAMGTIADRYSHDRLPVTETVDVLRGASTTFPGLAQQAPGKQGDDLRAAAAVAQRALATYDARGALPELETANALRAIESSGGALAAWRPRAPRGARPGRQLRGACRSAGSRRCRSWWRWCCACSSSRPPPVDRGPRQHHTADPAMAGA